MSENINEVIASTSEEVAKVYRTTDYSIFQTLLGNRGVRDPRVQKIRKSILKNGYIFNPIIVNEKMEIIDGQGRLAALKSLGMPVDYVAKEGLNVNDCITMNVTQTQWGSADYTKSFADLGSEDYENLQLLAEEFPLLGLGTIVTILTESYGSTNGYSKANLKTGGLKCGRLAYIRAQQTCRYVSRFAEVIKKKSKGKKAVLFGAVAFIYEQCHIDSEKLFENFSNFYMTDLFTPYASFTDALNSLSDIYNYRRTNRVSFAAKYRDYVNARSIGGRE